MPSPLGFSPSFSIATVLSGPTEILQALRASKKWAESRSAVTSLNSSEQLNSCLSCAPRVVRVRGDLNAQPYAPGKAGELGGCVFYAQECAIRRNFSAFGDSPLVIANRQWPVHPLFVHVRHPLFITVSLVSSPRHEHFPRTYFRVINRACERS